MKNPSLVWLRCRFSGAGTAFISVAVTYSSYWCWKAVQAVYENINAEPARVIHTVFQSIPST